MFGFSLNAIANELTAQVIRAITGRMLTEDQIKRITSHYLGRHFAELFPEPEQERKAKERINVARDHIAKASQIMADVRLEIEAQSETLNKLADEIEKNKKVAVHYQNAASVNEDAFKALRTEMEASLKAELVRQSEEGKRLRQFVSFLVWLITLILGATLGRYFDTVLGWIVGVASHVSGF